MPTFIPSNANYWRTCICSRRSLKICWKIQHIYSDNPRLKSACLFIRQAVDIEGLLGFMKHNKFHLGLFSIVYLVMSFRSAPGTNIFKGWQNLFHY